jgi:type 1 fimbria pilin
VSGISLSGSLNTSGCSITIGSTLTTASITVQTGTFTATVITLESL